MEYGEGEAPNLDHNKIQDDTIQDNKDTYGELEGVSPGSHERSPKDHSPRSHSPGSHSPGSHSPETYSSISYTAESHGSESHPPKANSPKSHTPESLNTDGHVQNGGGSESVESETGSGPSDVPKEQSVLSDSKTDDPDEQAIVPDRLNQAYSLAQGRTYTAIPSEEDQLYSPLAYQPEERDPETNEVIQQAPKYLKLFRYDHCATDLKQFPSLEYTICEEPPYRARINPLERGVHCLLTGDDFETVTSGGNYTSAKGNVCMRGGSWYFEIDVVRPNVRIGIGRREAGCEAPVGYSSYSYGIQSQRGLGVHCGRTRKFMEPFGAGDTIGFHVHIPVDSRLKRFRRNRVPIKFRNQLWFESLNYKNTVEMDDWESQKSLPPPKPEELIPGSFCKVYKNGVLAGTLAEPLRDFRPPHSQFGFWLKLPSIDDGLLGYFPMISVHGGGAARLNCGPDFKYPVPEGATGLHERYNQQVADDFAMDLIDELFYEDFDQELPDLERNIGLPEFKVRKVVRPNPFSRDENKK